VSLKGKRILIAKPGLDGHDVGAKVIALALRDAGADVIYTGLRKSPEYIARIAVDEDVDAVGLSILSGSHNELVSETIDLLREMDADNVKIFVGGSVSGDDIGKLKDLGVAGVFTSEMKIEDTLSDLSEALG
jgi:methylmalonyl-CoA mutase C-terminal domain/subunit